MDNRLTVREYKNLLGILWLTLLVWPFLSIIGAGLLMAAFALILLPPAWAALLMVDGNLLGCLLLAVGWALALWIARPFFRWIFQAWDPRL